MDNHMHDADWRKSSYSNGAGDCVEVGMSRKSSYSNGSGACVEVGRATGRIAVRDTKDHGNGPVIQLTPGDWARFTASIK